MKMIKTAAMITDPTSEQRDRVDLSPIHYRGLKDWLTVILLLVGTIYLAFSIRDVLLLFAVVFLLAMVLNPIVARLQRRGLSRGIGVALLFLGLIVLFAAGLYFLIPPLLDQLDELIRKMPGAWNKIQTQSQRLLEHYPDIQKSIPETNSLIGTFGAKAGELAQIVLRSTFNFVGGVFGLVFAVLLLVFVLIDPQPLVRQFLVLVPDAHRNGARRSLTRLNIQMAAWARGVLINGSVTAVSTGVLMWIIGVHPALVFGFIAFLGEFIPMIGPVICSAPALVVALSLGPAKFAEALGAILLVQQVETNLLIPFVLGRAMDLSPISILFFTLAMSSLFGLTGAVLAVPAAALFRILVDEFYLSGRQIDRDKIDREAREIVRGEAKI